jgi:WW domain-containing oxidoreductase
LKRRFGRSTTADEVVAGLDLSGRTAVVTGANSGIGYETARALAGAGARVILACRELSGAEDAAARIRAAHPEARAEARQLDLGSLSSVREFSARLAASVDALICNAGVYGPYAETEDGFERTVGVCHIGHFQLAVSLRDRLRAAAPARVVMVSSNSHRMPAKLRFDRLPLRRDNYRAVVAYGQAKLCNVLMANELTRRWGPEGITANSLHPGTLMLTSIGRRSFAARLLLTAALPFAKSLVQGAATSVYCATAPELEGAGGRYFIDCNPEPASEEARSPEVAARLWELSEGWISRSGALRS